MIQKATLNDKPWCTIGDFNVKTSVEEKIGGVPYKIRKSMEFTAVIEACGLFDIGLVVINSRGPTRGLLIREFGRGFTGLW